MVSISVIIPTLNDDETIRMCLESVFDQTLPTDQYEVIIVDGGSVDDTLSIVSEFNCVVEHEEKNTIAYARELGVSISKGEFVAFTDADCVVPSDWLEVLRDSFKKEDIAGVGGPNLTPEDDSSFANAVGQFFRSFGKVGARYGYNTDSVSTINHNPTCNVMYRSSVISEVGGFNKNLVTVDDEELDFRIRKRGYVLLFNPNAPVDHYRRPSWGGFARMAYRYGYGRGQAMWIDKELREWFHIAPPATIVILFTTILGSRASAVPVVIPVSLFLIGEAILVTLSGYMNAKTDYNILSYALLAHVWLICWSAGIVSGTFHHKEVV